MQCLEKTASPKAAVNLPSDANHQILTGDPWRPVIRHHKYNGREFLSLTKRLRTEHTYLIEHTYLNKSFFWWRTSRSSEYALPLASISCRNALTVNNVSWTRYFGYVMLVGLGNFCSFSGCFSSILTDPFEFQFHTSFFLQIGGSRQNKRQNL